MQAVKVEGIVLKEINYQESSKILTVFTKEYGIISIMSKGCRNLKSKLRGVSNKLSYANFYINYKKDGISTLTDADTIDTLKNIIMDIEKISYVSYLVDLTDQVYKHSKSNEIYDIFISCIKKINENYNLDVITIILELKLLKYLGINPNVDSCNICGNTNNILTISVENGGFVCQNCYISGKIYPSQVIKLIRMFMYIGIDKIEKINIKEENIKELYMFTDEYYDALSGIYLKSKDFLKNIKKLYD